MFLKEENRNSRRTIIGAHAAVWVMLRDQLLTHLLLASEVAHSWCEWLAKGRCCQQLLGVSDWCSAEWGNAWKFGNILCRLLQCYCEYAATLWNSMQMCANQIAVVKSREKTLMPKDFSIKKGLGYSWLSNAEVSLVESADESLGRGSLSIVECIQCRRWVGYWLHHFRGFLETGINCSRWAAAGRQAGSRWMKQLLCPDWMHLCVTVS